MTEHRKRWAWSGLVGGGGVSVGALLMYAAKAGGLEATVDQHSEILREIAPCVREMRVTTSSQFARLEAQYAEILRRLDKQEGKRP